MGMGSPKFLVDSHVRLQRHWAKHSFFRGSGPVLQAALPVWMGVHSGQREPLPGKGVRA